MMKLSRHIRKSIPLQLRVMRSRSLCDTGRARVVAAVLLAMLFGVSLYYPGPGSWNFHHEARLELMRRYAVGLFSNDVSPTTEWYDPTEEFSQFVLNTVGCKIPYMKVGFSVETSVFDPGCGERLLHLEKINQTHARLTLAEDKFRNTIQNCSLTFVLYEPGAEKSKIKYSPHPIVFSKNVTFKLETDFIKTKCYPTEHHKTLAPSEDLFAVAKKQNRQNMDGTDKDSGVRKWSVLVIGMDTMSRARMLDTMQRTVTYFHGHRWIDFKGYHKIADNTWPNLMALLTGKKRSTIDKACRKTMNDCNHLLMWNKYKEAGYVTAYAEDYLSLPDTFAHKGYKEPPTDHYMRPFFQAGEHIPRARSQHVSVCTGTKTSGEQILDYAKDIAETYKDNPFFGFFWINSNSHNIANLPEAIDGKLRDTFQQLNATGALDNTFVIFLSDHGVRFGSKREPIESYYEERLPALFVLVPTAFQEENRVDFDNLLSNRLRLVTPYDLYLTLDDILQRSSESNDSSPSEACPRCQSLFTPISTERTCSDAAVEEKWCSCHSVDQLEKHDKEGVTSVNTVLAYIQNFSAHLETKNCTQCEHFTLHSIMRMHYYYNWDKSIKYMVVAFTLSPGYVGYEATVSHDGNKYEVVGQISIISPHFGKGYCVINKAVSLYCYCGRAKCKHWTGS